MGRGNSTQDKFAGVFGARRGSRSAQDLRDKQEMVETIHAYFDTHERLTSNSLIPLSHIFSAEDPLIQEALANCIWHKIQMWDGRTGWNDFLGLLFDAPHHIPPRTRTGLRSFAVSYLTGERHSTPEDRPPENSHEQAGGVAKAMAEYADKRSSSDIESDKDIISAIANVWREDPGAQGCPLHLVEALARQPEQHLRFYGEWEDAVREGVSAGHYDKTCHLAVDALWPPSTPPPASSIRELRRAFIERSRSPEFTGQISPIMKAA